MKLTLRITFTDGNSKDIVANAADLVAFEDKFNIAVTRIETEQKLTHMLFLAWHSEYRTKATALGFDEWVATVDQVGAGSDPK